MTAYKSLAAKCDINFIPESPLEPDLERVLKSFFSGSLIEHFQNFGGTLSINLVTGDRKLPKDQKESEVGKDFIRFLSDFRGDERELRERLEPLVTRQLNSIAKHFKIPVRSNATANDLVNAIASYVLSSQRWTGISGKSPSSATHKQAGEYTTRGPVGKT